MNFVELLKQIKEALDSPVVQWLLWTLGSIVMIFTPDHIDRIIEGILALLGIKCLYDASQSK